MLVLSLYYFVFIMQAIGSRIGVIKQDYFNNTLVAP
jgi:hypothetical protein